MALASTSDLASRFGNDCTELGGEKKIFFAFEPTGRLRSVAESAARQPNLQEVRAGGQ